MTLPFDFAGLGMFVVPANVPSCRVFECFGQGWSGVSSRLTVTCAFNLDAPPGSIAGIMMVWVSFFLKQSLVANEVCVWQRFLSGRYVSVEVCCVVANCMQGRRQLIRGNFCSKGVVFLRQHCGLLNPNSTCVLYPRWLLQRLHNCQPTFHRSMSAPACSATLAERGYSNVLRNGSIVQKMRLVLIRAIS